MNQDFTMKLLWLNVAITCACFYAEACQPGQERFRDSCYQLLNEPMAWDQGDAACSAMGGGLAVPDSLEEHQFIWEMFTGKVKDGDPWIGCHDRVEEGKWVKSSGEGECNFFMWAGNQPSSSGGDNCMQLWRGANGFMDDTSCSDQQFIICESPAPPAAVPTMSCLQRHADARSSSHCTTGHVIKEFSTKGVFACSSACLGEPRCRSFNLRRGGPGEMMTCQLNDITVNEADDKNIRLDDGCKSFTFLNVKRVTVA